ncbi:MAG: iron-containing alcohol dehydrogenase [Chlorobium sp.]|nr:iron-containing alcohol dehydrogenase [Chlorobium sp.]MCW8815774.1 iron-containing alcohol dehydrogenase [Chlorobium sp.]
MAALFDGCTIRKAMSSFDFSLLRQPRVYFGPGRFQEIPSLITEFGTTVLLVCGAVSLQRSGALSVLAERLESDSLDYHLCTITGEPSPELVDRAVTEFSDAGIEVVVAIGGGSVLDAGKAISAMLMKNEPVERFIEGQPGFREHDGLKVPFIAVPTTAGTGSEATNNAVLSSVGKEGYKRSLRHPAFVPDIALIDPELMLTMPAALTVASGMDACTQLLEALLSPFASPFTEAVAISGIESFSRSFLPACEKGAEDIDARGGMAYAALMSGIALANAGLGIVHGFASSVGGFVDIPHGTLCSTLLCPATRENIYALREGGSGYREFLSRYARVGRILSGNDSLDDRDACNVLIEVLDSWQQELNFPLLSNFGVTEKDLDYIVGRTRCKSNPVDLDDRVMKKILQERL